MSRTSNSLWDYAVSNMLNNYFVQHSVQKGYDYYPFPEFWNQKGKGKYDANHKINVNNNFIVFWGGLNHPYIISPDFGNPTKEMTWKVKSGLKNDFKNNICCDMIYPKPPKYLGFLRKEQ